MSHAINIKGPFRHTGTVALDTSNDQVDVSGLEQGSSHAYSLNGGSTWTTFTGSSFTLSGDGAKTVVVHQTDGAGNVSSSSALAFTLDTTNPGYDHEIYASGDHKNPDVLSVFATANIGVTSVHAVDMNTKILILGLVILRFLREALSTGRGPPAQPISRTTPYRSRLQMGQGIRLSRPRRLRPPPASPARRSISV